MTELSLLETYINVMADEDFQVPEFVAMALSTAGGSGWKGTEFLACWLEAFRLAESGHIEEALNLLSRASELARAMKSKLAEAACLIWLAYEFVNQDNVIQTSQYLDVGLSLLSQLKEQDTYNSGLIELATYIQTRLAWLQRGRGELIEALTLTNEALATWRRLNFEFRIVEATVLKVQLLVDLGLRDQAQAVYQELLASGIKGGSNYFTIGLCAYKDLHDLDGAERAYRLCLEQEPKHASAWNHLACVLYDKDETDEAVRCWRESLKLHNENADALAGLALGLWTQGPG